MKFFFPDSQDLVDPSFDFEKETRAADRQRQRDDLYAHEVFSEPAYDGLLVSKGIVDGYGESGGRYSMAQRHRLLRVGAPEFFRIKDRPGPPIPIMGDCGAFTYFREEKPPYTVDEVLDFYVDCQFDLGISLDHVIVQFDQRWDNLLTGFDAPEELRFRQDITLTLAAEFMKKHRSQGLSFTPLGVAQGWSPLSYAASVKALQDMGYSYIAVGGLVPLKTRDILLSLEAIAVVRRPSTQLHLLGVTRLDQIPRFASYGGVSFDSTSPLRQAFKDDKDNYYTPTGAYSAVRVPQVEANPRLLRQIKAGVVSQGEARRLELACLRALADYEEDRISLATVLNLLSAYEALYDPSGDHRSANERALSDRPWLQCQCDVCATLKHHVILFRGAERNRRRGFHNLWVAYRRLQGEITPAEQHVRSAAP